MRSLQDLEDEYASMNDRHWRSVDKMVVVNEDGLKKTCVALTSQAYWNLEPVGWNRLMSWLEPLRECGIFYNAVQIPGQKSGVLHWTLQQLLPFVDGVHSLDSSGVEALDLDKVLEPLRGLELLFHGLVLTPSGIALAGVPRTGEMYKGVCLARQRLWEECGRAGLPYKAPYENNLCHATLFRFSRVPSEQQLAYIRDGIMQWKHCYFGSMRPVDWIFGHLSLRVRAEEIQILRHTTVPWLIAHRGLVDGPNKSLENKFSEIKRMVVGRQTCEIDVWFVHGTYFLGHDAPMESIDLAYILDYKDYLLIHAKNVEAFSSFCFLRSHGGHDLHFFYHSNENVVFSSRGIVIPYPGETIYPGMMHMMPESATPKANYGPVAICSDYINPVQGENNF